MPFNLTQAIIQSSLTVILTVMIGFIVFYSRILAQKQPEHQVPFLQIFSRMAAQCVEQEHPNALDKKRLATGICADMFRSYHSPVPAPEALDTAIGSAMFEIRLWTAKEEDHNGSSDT